MHSKQFEGATHWPVAGGSGTPEFEFVELVSRAFAEELTLSRIGRETHGSINHLRLLERELQVVKTGTPQGSVVYEDGHLHCGSRGARGATKWP